MEAEGSVVEAEGCTEDHICDRKLDGVGEQHGLYGIIFQQDR